MKDIFDDIHRLLKKAEYEKALGELLASDGGKINSPYDQDLNHAWYTVGDAFYKLEQFEDAIAAFRKALENWPEDKEAALALSNSYSENKMPKEAELALKSFLEKNPANETLIYNLANALFDQEKWDEAIPLYTSIKRDTELYGLAQKNLKMAKKLKTGK